MADTTGMFDSPSELLVRQPSLRLLLEEYRAAQQDRRAANPEADAWVPRLKGMDGIEKELLSQLHGRLIALGFVKFQLTTGPSLGLEYQLSPLGRRALGDAPAPTAEDADADPWAQSA